MIVDFRVRPPFAGYLDTHMYRDRERTARMARGQRQHPPRALAEADWDTFLAEFDDAGVGLGVVPGRRAAPQYGDVPNEDVADMVKAADGRLIGFAAVTEGAPDAPDELQRGVEELGLAGLALDPGFADEPRTVDDEALEPLYERCQRLEVPVMVTLSGNAGPDIGYAFPVYLDRVAARHPDLRIIVAHGGWPWVPQVLGVAFRRPNVWISPDQYLLGVPGWQQYVEAANTFLGDRLLYGSSYPFMPFHGAVEFYRAAPFAPDVIQGVLGGNARRVLDV